MKSLILRTHEVKRLQEAGSVTVVRVATDKRGVYSQLGNPCVHPAVTSIAWDGKGFRQEASDRVKQMYSTTFPCHLLKCPFGVVGESLWVKEAVRYSTEHDNHYYIADDKGVGNMRHHFLLKRSWPAIRLPLIASRFTVSPASIAAKRLKEITFDEVIGAGTPKASAVPYGNYRGDTIEAFWEAWDKANKKHPWATSPWVWVANMKKVEASK